MLTRFGFGSADRRKAMDLYGAVVTQARDPALFTMMGVSDTPQGRYEMLALHLVLVLERLRAGGERHKAFSQLLVETFVTDMDDCMREMGVGDLSVPKKVKRAAGGLYDRTLAYRAALGDPTGAELATRLDENVWQGSAEAGQLAMLAGYARRVERHLAGLAAEKLVAGAASFPSVIE